MNNLFIVCWDNLGLECIVPVHNPKYEKLIAALKNEPVPESIDHIVFKLILRARYNTPRHYEIYSIKTDKGIEKEDLEKLFKDEPQSAADLIRNKGVKIYSDRIVPSRIVIL